MGAGCALLDPPNVQGGRFEIDLIPPQIDQLGRSQAMPVGDKDHRGVAVAMAIAPGSLDQPLDLVLGKVLAGPQIAVAASTWCNCSF